MSQLAYEYTRPNLVGYQQEIVDCEARFTVTEAGTKTGKTASHMVWLFEQALKTPSDCFVWWVAPVYAQAEIAYRRMQNQLDNGGEFFQSHDGKMRLTLPNGQMVEFKSAKNPDDLFGEDVYAAVFDEFTRAKAEAWYALRTTLSSTRGPCKLIGNVKGRKNWGHRLALEAKNGKRNYRNFKITADDAVAAGILDQEEVDQAREDLPEAVFKELYMAEASEDGSNPFGQPYIQKCVTELSDKDAVCYGVDLAKKQDWTVIIGLDEDRNVCDFARFQHDWQTTTRLVADVIGDLTARVDSTGVGDPIVEELQREVENVEGVNFTQRSKQQLMEGLAVSIQKERLGFPEGPITDELDVFEYEYTQNGVKYTAPSGLHDDCVCALALADSCWHLAEESGDYFVI